MVEKNLKLVIDTNILISATISKQTRNYLDKIISEEQIEIYFSKELHREYEEVKTRRKIAKYLNPASEKYSKLIFDTFHLIEIKEKNKIIVRDEKDDYILSLALTCDADYILTGDEDLLVLEKISKIKILTIREFMDKFYPV
ncbi:MAG TPA: putative toxin-antitoxin system toxin component, PIN family [Leptospiraceae bacterium]|nr:putative toxin-antitoxin system toxin component, PIN family [Leptospiraceae bacterium]HNC01635.1 putative toxin-antitoxin system toxin component, PIN family [Leptospiraceae bacterium]HNK95102.1 putative toxin-antitoxin system toxin component, PIN family [Leptospiraceae bacterium]